MGAGINARSQWMSVDVHDPSTYSQCSITYNLDIDWDWPKLCTVIEHELGHLAGHEHVDDPHNVMSPYYVFPTPECAAGQPGAAAAPAPVAAVPTAAAATHGDVTSKRKVVKRKAVKRRAQGARRSSARCAKRKAAAKTASTGLTTRPRAVTGRVERRRPARQSRPRRRSAAPSRAPTATARRRARAVPLLGT